MQGEIAAGAKKSKACPGMSGRQDVLVSDAIRGVQPHQLGTLPLLLIDLALVGSNIANVKRQVTPHGMSGVLDSGSWRGGIGIEKG